MEIVRPGGQLEIWEVTEIVCQVKMVETSVWLGVGF